MFRCYWTTNAGEEPDLFADPVNELNQPIIPGNGSDRSSSKQNFMKDEILILKKTGSLRPDSRNTLF